MYHTEIMMPDAVMPCRLHECRDYYKRNRGSRLQRSGNNFTGFLYRNSKEKIKALEDDFPLEDSITFKNYNFPIKVLHFSMMQKKNSKANRRRMSDEGLLFVLGGQHYAHERTSSLQNKVLVILG